MSNDANLLSNAIRLAAAAHRDQVDKNGQPYILHPIRVMMQGTTLDERIVGVLHDVVEDSNIALATISEMFGGNIAYAIEALTRSSDETYEMFIARVAENPLALRVKIYDLTDNMAVDRSPAVKTLKHIERQLRYTHAMTYLMERRV